MRNTPEIKFIVDQSIEYGVNISKKIDEVTKDLKDEAGDIDECKKIDLKELLKERKKLPWADTSARMAIASDR